GGRTRFGFTGREQDESTRLVYYRARWLDPLQGRFLREDPIGFQGGMNFYEYVNNNPININDPLGLIGNSCTDEMPPGQKAHCDRLAELMNKIINGFQSGATWVKGLIERYNEQVGAPANHGPGTEEWNGHREQLRNRRQKLIEALNKW